MDEDSLVRRCNQSDIKLRHSNVEGYMPFRWNIVRVSAPQIVQFHREISSTLLAPCKPCSIDGSHSRRCSCIAINKRRRSPQLNVELYQAILFFNDLSLPMSVAVFHLDVYTTDEQNLHSI